MLRSVQHTLAQARTGGRTLTSLAQLCKLDVFGAHARERRTKIVATIGPASWGNDGVEALLGAGMNVMRLNFSHGSHADKAEAIAGTTLNELSVCQ